MQECYTFGPWASCYWRAPAPTKSALLLCRGWSAVQSDSASEHLLHDMFTSIARTMPCCDSREAASPLSFSSSRDTASCVAYPRWLPWSRSVTLCLIKLLEPGCDLAVPVPDFRDVWKKGRMVGMHAAMMTIFCSTLSFRSVAASEPRGD